MICGMSSWTARVLGAGTRRWGRSFTAGKISSSSTRRCAGVRTPSGGCASRTAPSLRGLRKLGCVCVSTRRRGLTPPLMTGGGFAERLRAATDPPAQGSGRHISMVRSLVPRLSRDVALPLSGGRCGLSLRRRLRSTSSVCCCRCTRRPPRDPRTMWRLYHREGLRGRNTALLASLSETILA